MAKIWKSEEFEWKREGFIKKSEEFLWKNDEFVWKSESERIYMAQRYSKYRFFDVNCILSILFQVQSWGCPGKPKFQFHILCGRGRLYIHDELVELGDSHCLRTKPLNGRECESMSPDLPPGCGSDWSCWPIFWIQSRCCRDEGPGGSWEAVDDLIVVDIVDICLCTGILLYIVDVIKLSRTFLVKNLIVVSFRSWNV